MFLGAMTLMVISVIAGVLIAVFARSLEARPEHAWKSILFGTVWAAASAWLLWEMWAEFFPPDGTS